MTACDEVGGGPQPSGPRVRLDHEIPLADADQLRRAFRRHAAGVAVITASSSSGPVGFTATSLASVSTDPPLLSFNISRSSSSWPAVSLSRFVGVHLLGEAQQELAVRFSTSGVDRFAAPTVWAPGPRQVPILDDCVAWLVGAVDQRVEAGDHAIVVVRVVHIGGPDADSAPLIYHSGGFVRSADRPRPRLLRRGSRDTATGPRT